MGPANKQKQTHTLSRWGCPRAYPPCDETSQRSCYAEICWTMWRS